MKDRWKIEHRPDMTICTHPVTGVQWVRHKGQRHWVCSTGEMSYFPPCVWDLARETAQEASDG